MSEMRRIAAALVGTRTETFESRYGAEASRAKVDAALPKVDTQVTRVDLTWPPAAMPPRLEVRFSPGTKVGLFLRLASIVLTLAVLASIWLVMRGEETSMRFLVPLMTVLAILGFPMAVLAIGSSRESDEARVVKAIRRAIVEEEQA
jgi:hypothetical protein